LVRLDPREVGTFTLREAILAVKLELSGDDGVLAPAVHVKRGLRKNECTSIRYTRVFIDSVATTGNSTSSNGGSVQRNLGTAKVGFIVRVGGAVPVSTETSEFLARDVVKSTSISEKTVGINVGAGISSN